MAGGVFGHEVDFASDGVAVHVGGHHLVHLDGLNHVGRNQVELHVACVALCRRHSVAVDSHRGKVGRSASHLSEPGLTLVVLHVDAVDAFQGVADVRVGELAHLIGAHHIGHTHVLLLHLQGLALTVEGSVHHHFLELVALAQDDVSLHVLAHQLDDVGLGRIAHVGHLHLVGSGLHVGQGVETVHIACYSCMQIFHHDGCSWQSLMLCVDNTSADDSAHQDIAFGFCHGDCSACGCQHQGRE